MNIGELYSNGVLRGPGNCIMDPGQAGVPNTPNYVPTVMGPVSSAADITYFPRPIIDEGLYGGLQAPCRGPPAGSPALCPTTRDPKGRQGSAENTPSCGDVKKYTHIYRSHTQVYMRKGRNVCICGHIF